jgi:hypothetical protein
VGEIVTVLITIGGLLFLRSLGPTDASGSEVPLFAPAFTDFWLPALLAVLAAMAVLHVMVFIVGRWTMALAVGHAALRVAFALPLIVLALNGTLVNPAFAAQIGWPSLAEGNRPAMLTVAVGTTLVGGWEILKPFLRARRARGSGPLVGASRRSA